MITAFIKTYGCQANVADSLHLENYLKVLGCNIVRAESLADLIIINSCAIREKAEHKMFSYLGGLQQYKDIKPYLAVGVIGCVASYRKKEIMSRVPYVNFVFSAHNDIGYFKAYLTDLIVSISTEKKLYYRRPDEYKPVKRRDCDVVALVEKQKLCVPQTSVSFQVASNEFKRSMVNIMRGCNNYCSYCIVPFTTGRERSFPMRSIVDMIGRDVTAGTREITLLGQNVNSYKDPDTGAGFAMLLEQVAKIEGQFWVRFVSPHPKDMTTEVIDMIAGHDKLCSYIHLPLQSGSNKILNAMNRTYTIENYLDLVEAVRIRLPYATITTDIIVGFPGETDADYQATRDVVEAVRFHTIFSFVYSPRKYTKAAQFKDSCPLQVKFDRLHDLQNRQREIGTQVNKECIGKTVKVLLEQNLVSGEFVGRTEGNVKVVVVGDGLDVNQFIDVLVEDAQQTDIRGKVVRKVIKL